MGKSCKRGFGRRRGKGLRGKSKLDKEQKPYRRVTGVGCREREE